MNKLEVNQVGGFPMTTRILDEIQKAHAVFNSLGGLAGNFTILDGCVTTGTNVSDGFVFINGEVFDFKGGLAQTKVIIKETVENLVFQNNNSNPVIKTRYVTFGTGVNAIDWADFKRPIETKALEVLLGAINTSLNVITTKLNTIEVGAKVQLQTDWNQNDNTKKDYLKNRPNITSPYLHKGSYDFGDVFDEDLLTVSIPDVGTANYMVLGGLVSKSANFANDANVWCQTREHTATSFKLVVKEQYGNVVQKLTFQFIIIPL